MLHLGDYPLMSLQDARRERDRHRERPGLPICHRERASRPRSARRFTWRPDHGTCSPPRYPNLSVPAIRSSQLFGGTTFNSTDGEFGGQGYNHPSSFGDTFAYRPVLKANTFVGEVVRNYTTTATSGYEHYSAMVDGVMRTVTRHCGRYGLAITVAGLLPWSVALPAPATSRVLSARCLLGPTQTAAVLDIFDNGGTIASLGLRATADGKLVTTSAAGTALIDWELVVC